ncbi:MAG: methyltransferase domain-containing protein [Candidatus Melainabacteria bacterium]|nr:methyltransferase domain-containing protein [Candidatus Melainabacteria bacterium]
MKNAIIKLFGLTSLVLFGDPPSFDRFIWLKKYLKPGFLRTLDAGCGSGTFTLYAAKLGNDALGISFDKRNNSVAQERAMLLGIQNANFIEWDLRNLSSLSNDIGLFDQIICFETIEHIKEDCKLLSALSKLLNPGGRILLTAPYKYYNHLFTDKVSEYEDGGHVRWGYTHEEMGDIFTDAGLELETKEYISGFFSQQICNLQRILSFVFGDLSWFMVFPLRTRCE